MLILDEVMEAMGTRRCAAVLLSAADPSLSWLVQKGSWLQMTLSQYVREGGIVFLMPGNCGNVDAILEIFEAPWQAMPHQFADVNFEMVDSAEVGHFSIWRTIVIITTLSPISCILFVVYPWSGA